MVSFMPRPPYPLGKSPRYLLNVWLCGPLGLSSRLEDETSFASARNRTAVFAVVGGVASSLYWWMNLRYTVGILPVVDYGIRGFPLICWCANCDTWFCVCTHGTKRLFAPRCAVDRAVMATEAESEVPGNHWEFFRAPLCVICEPRTLIFFCLVYEQTP